MVNNINPFLAVYLGDWGRYEYWQWFDPSAAFVWPALLCFALPLSLSPSPVTSFIRTILILAPGQTENIEGNWMG